MLGGAFTIYNLNRKGTGVGLSTFCFLTSVQRGIVTIDGAVNLCLLRLEFLSGLPPSHILDQDFPLFKMKKKGLKSKKSQSLKML